MAGSFAGWLRITGRIQAYAWPERALTWAGGQVRRRWATARAEGQVRRHNSADGGAVCVVVVNGPGDALAYGCVG
jgi:hypothetical protein